jgi:hypothetical protein
MAVINMKSSTFLAIDEKYCPEAGMDLLGCVWGGHTPLALARGGAIFHDKAKKTKRDTVI